MQGTSTPPALTPPGIDSQPELRGLKLNQEWAIGEPIPSGNERHSAVYSVLISETGQPSEDLETHVFSLHGIEPKLRKYRQRCIKRMKDRTKLKVQVENVTIVVITTSQTEEISALELVAEPQPLSIDEQQKTDSCTTSTEKLDHKTLYQREAQRIRQRERRQARRTAKALHCDDRTAHSGHNITEEISLLDETKELSMFLSFLRELLGTWDLWRAMPFMYINPAKALEQSLVQTAAALQTMEEMESYLKVRRSEIISLQRHQAKLSSALMHHLDQLINMKREQVQHKGNTPLLKDSKEAVKDRSEAELEHRTKLVTLEGLANEIIDNLLIPCKSIVRSVERKLLEFVSDKLQGQIEDFERKFSCYKDRKGPSYPQCAPTFEHVVRLMEWAKIRGQ